MLSDEERDALPAEIVEAAPEIEALDQPEADAEEVPPQPVSFIDWLRGLFSGPVAQRLDALNAAIASHPQSASNYVLRGEIWLDKGEYEMAAADFEWA